MKKKLLFLKNLGKRLLLPILHHLTEPNEEAVWIFGFQKSGTSAIAGLLAHMADKTVTIDTKYLWAPYSIAIKKGELELEQHVKKFSYPFSKDILKEPGATFYIDKIESFFTLKKYIFIVRNPFDNIRSILNRLDLPGNKMNIRLEDVPPLWRSKFPGHGRNYIRDLAELWLEANDQDPYMKNERCILIKYEDFKNSKEKAIASIVKKLDFPIKNSIQEIKDHPFQPTGTADVDLLEFFGESNAKVIQEICGKRMKELNYDLLEIIER